MSLLSKIIEYVKEDSTFLKQSSILFIGIFIYYIINYVYQFLMGRMLGPEDYGILAVLFSILYVFVAPINAIQTIITKFVANFKAKKEYGKIKTILIKSTKKIFVVSFVIFLVFLLLSPFIAEFLQIPTYMPVAVFSISLLGFFVLAIARGVLQGLQKFKRLSLNYLSEGITKLLLGIFLILGGLGVTGALWGLNASVFLAFIFAFIILRPLFKEKLEKIDSKSIYKYSIPVILAMSAVTFLYTIDVILVKHYFEPILAGYYAAASLVAKVIFFGTMAISMTMFPKVAELHALKKDYKRIFHKSLLLISGICAIAVIIYFLFPELVISMLFGREFISAAPLISLFGFAISLFSISYLFINYYLSINKVKQLYIILPVFIIIETALIILFHSSLIQVVQILTVTMLFLLLTLIPNYWSK